MLAGAAVVLLSPSTGLSQARSEWVKLGVRHVRRNQEVDILRVGLHRGAFTGLRIAAEGNAVFIEKLAVHFSTGERETLPVRSIINAGSQSRDMLLPGLIHAISHIEITYRRARIGVPATLTFYGRRIS